MDFTSTQFLLGALAIGGLITLIIFFGRLILDRPTELKPIVLRKTTPVFLLGGVFALALSFMAFNITSYTTTRTYDYTAFTFEEDIMVAPERTVRRKEVPPPPPKPSPIIEIDPEPVDVVQEDRTVIEDIKPITEVVGKPAAKPASKPVVAPPPAVVEVPDVDVTEIDEIVTFAEQMPQFSGCDDILDDGERKMCADKRLFEFVYSRIKYPGMARENGKTGTVVVTFVVEKDGSISGAKVIKDPGYGMGKEALRVIKQMPKWKPGKQNKRPVKVQFNMPIKFTLKN